MNDSIVTRIVRYTARIWGAIVAGFAAFLLISSGFGIDESGAGLQTWKEILEFLCFPLGVSFGLLWGWRSEIKGGILAVASVLLLWALRPDLTQSLVFTTVILTPGLLFVWLGFNDWRLQRRVS